MSRRRDTVLTHRIILQALRANRGMLDKYAVRRIGVFGSYTTGRHTADSDIDFLVEFERPSYDNFVGLARALRRLFGKRIDILTPDGLGSIRVPEIAERIRKSIAYV